MKILTMSASKNIPALIDAIDMYRDFIKLEEHLAYKKKIHCENPVEYIDILINFYIESEVISDNLAIMANKLISLLEEYNDNNKKVKKTLNSMNKENKNISLLGHTISEINTHIYFVNQYITIFKNPLEVCTSKELETFSNKKAIDAGIMRASRNLYNESFSMFPSVLHHSIIDIILEGIYTIENDLKEIIDNDMITIVIH